MGFNPSISLAVTAGKSNKEVVAIFHSDKPITVAKIIFNTILEPVFSVLGPYAVDDITASFGLPDARWLLGSLAWIGPG
jgi:hypothetical protein